MKKIRTLALLTLLMLALCACGKTEAPAETTAAPTVAPAPLAPLTLTEWTMSASTWSSPNGATVHLTATPAAYSDSQSAAFIVRLEGDDIENVPCQWDGTHYTASADLNAADGYCYYVTLTGADGETAEIAINTPAAPTNEAVINMETSLNTFCTLLVEASDADSKKLTITGGIAQIQLPRITNDGEAITCTDAVLVLSFNGAEADRKELKLPEPDPNGLYTLNIADNRFDIPAMEDDQQLTLRLDVTLSNGQILTDANGTWSYIGGQLVSAVG